jgi:hypothetical protein
MTLRSIAILCALGCLVSNFPALASSGTGFAIANGSLIITNFHVIRGCTTITIPNVGSGVIKATDPNVDVAVIEPEQPVKAFLRFRSRYSQLKLGEEIIVIGFPLKGLLSSTPTVTTGIVSSLAGIRDDATRLQITAPIQPGNSGGPVLDRAGNVVGIAVSKLNVLKLAPLIGDIPQNANFAIPSSIVTPILDNYSVRYQSGTFDKERPISEIVSAASSAVVSVECTTWEALVPSAVAPSGPWAYFTSTLDVAGALRRIRMGPRDWKVWCELEPADAGTRSGGGARRMRRQRLWSCYEDWSGDVRRAGNDRRRQTRRRRVAQGSRSRPSRRPQKLRQRPSGRVPSPGHRLQQMSFAAVRLPS